MTTTESIKFLVAMIIMMNPLGSLSIFLDLTHKMNITQQREIARRSSVAIVIIMLLAVWSGEKILYFLGIFADKIVIAILMGHTSLGIFYIWEKRVKEKFL